MNENIAITAADGHGTFRAFVAYPSTDSPAPAVVVIQEIFGVNANMRSICENLASAGYIAVCPDLFWRQEPGVDLTDKTETEWARAFELYKGFNVDKGVEDIQACLSAARGLSGCNGRVGAVGYCLGGLLAFLTAARTDANACVSYYGVGLDERLSETGSIKNPLLMHIAEKDKFVPAAAREKILTSVKGNAAIAAFVYANADHAFARIGGAHYDATAARTANARTADFLATHLNEN